MLGCSKWETFLINAEFNLSSWTIFQTKTAKSSLSTELLFPSHVHTIKQIPFAWINSYFYFIRFQFERDGFMVFDDFYSPAEIAEMLKAGRALCHQAPKEDRKIFSTTDPETSQVRVRIEFYMIAKYKQNFSFIFRIVTNILSSLATKFATFSRLELLIRTTSFWYLSSLLLTKSVMLWLWNIRYSENTLSITESESCAGSSAINDQPSLNRCTFSRIQDLVVKSLAM